MGNVKNEMNKLWKDEDYLKIGEIQHEKLSQKDIEYTELLCFILEQQNWEYDLAIIKREDYDNFMKTDDEDVDMEMIIVDSSQFYEEFKKISNIDIMDENCFISMSYIDEVRNDVNLIVKDNNGINKRYVIGIVG